MAMSNSNQFRMIQALLSERAQSGRKRQFEARHLASAMHVPTSGNPMIKRGRSCLSPIARGPSIFVAAKRKRHHKRKSGFSVRSRVAVGPSSLSHVSSHIWSEFWFFYGWMRDPMGRSLDGRMPDRWPSDPPSSTCGILDISKPPIKMMEYLTWDTD